MAGDASANGLAWGPVFDDDLHRIELPDTSWVEVKRYITEGDEAAALDSARGRWESKMSAEERAKKGKRSKQEVPTEFLFDSGQYRLTVLQRIIKAWSFSKNGKSIPVNPDTVAALPTHTRDFIMEQVDAMNPGLGTEDDEEDLDASTPNISPTKIAPSPAGSATQS
jgi:hypothetical protein